MRPPNGSKDEPAKSGTGKRRPESLPPLVSAALEPGHPTVGARLARIARHGSAATRYTVLGDLAQGGMGRILRAWDEGLAREVAMKIVSRTPPPGSSDEECTDHERRLERFIDEARITGQLDHPGIVPVYEIGLDDAGNAFFTMPLVRGRDLKHVFSDVHAGADGWTLQRAIDVMHKVCLTVAFAHQKGVVHRDLKPENVMVGPFGEAYVMDWGLALLLGRSERRSIVGTPAYMSPEQAVGSGTVGPRSDVYSLGAILYELFARRMPHELSLETRVSEEQTLESVLNAPPRPLSELAPDVPPELMAISAKAMAPDPEARYASALEMADDLEAWLAGHVVSALEVGRFERWRKWRARNRALAQSLDALVAVSLVASAALLVQQRTWLREIHAKHDEVRVSAYAAGLSAADLGLRAHETAEARRRLEACDPDLRGWEWNHLRLRANSCALVLDVHQGGVHSVAVSPDGRTIASGAEDGTVRLWNAADGAPLASLAGHTDKVQAVAFAPDGTRLASASSDDTVCVWDVTSGVCEHVLTGYLADVVALAFSEDGSRLVSGDSSGNLVLSGVADGSELARRAQDGKDVLVSLAYVPCRDRIVAAYITGTVRVLDPERLSPLREARVSRSTLSCLGVDPTGTLLAVASERSAQLLDFDTLEPVNALLGHGRSVSSVAFSPEGWLATTGFDSALRVWELSTGRVLEFDGHESAVNSLAFFPDGRRIVTGSEDHTLRLWNLARVPVMSIVETNRWVDTLAFSPDGRRIAASARDRKLRILDARTGALLAEREIANHVDCLAWGPDNSLAYGSDEEAVCFASADDLAPRASLPMEGGKPRAVLLGPRGERLFTRDSAGLVHVHDLVHGGPPLLLATGDDQNTTLALSRDGLQLAAGGSDGTVWVWNTRTLARRVWHSGPAFVSALAFSPDGKRLAVGRQTSTIALLSSPHGTIERLLEGHESIVSSLGFSPDGKRIVSGSYDHTLRIWSPENSEALLTLHGHEAEVTAVAFDPVGEVIASASKDGSLRLWRTARAFEAATP